MPSRSLLDLCNLGKKKVFPLSSPRAKSSQPAFICPELYLLQLLVWKCNQSPFRWHRPPQPSRPPLHIQSIEQSNLMGDKEK